MTLLHPCMVAALAVTLTTAGCTTAKPCVALDALEPLDVDALDHWSLRTPELLRALNAVPPCARYADTPLPLDLNYFGARKQGRDIYLLFEVVGVSHGSVAFKLDDQFRYVGAYLM